MAGRGWQGGDGRAVTGCCQGGQRWAGRAELMVYFLLQVLYKTAWSESVGRDCAAYCAKKWV